MKKFLSLFAITALFFLGIISCNKGTQVDSLTFNQEELILPVGGTATLTLTILPYSASDNSIKWKSSDNAVATVSSISPVKCLVTGNIGGKATITATSKDGKRVAKCEVEVVTLDPEMISVKGGTFTMGTTDTLSFAYPAHQVTLKDYKIGKYIVTEKLWHTIMGGNINPESKDFPMMRITWFEVQAFIKKLNELTGKKYRLPTEAEWEFAARGGKDNQIFIYSGSNDIDEVAWYNGNSDNTPHPVGLKKPNELGIYDMTGNMWEWCNDWFDLYQAEPQDNPEGPETGSSRICRGGSFANPAQLCHITYRVRILPNEWGVIGLRLAHD